VYLSPGGSASTPTDPSQSHSALLQEAFILAGKKIKLAPLYYFHPMLCKENPPQKNIYDLKNKKRKKNLNMKEGYSNYWKPI
jgi:hypothetical protein